MVWRDWSSLVLNEYHQFSTPIMDPTRHALYMRPFGHLCDHTPFEDVLQDVLEDVFGLAPSPQAPHWWPRWAMSSESSHGGEPQKQWWGWGAQSWDADYYLEILGEERGRHHSKWLFSNCLVFGVWGFFIPRLSLGMKSKNLILCFC